jgi:hypothetical protein
MQYVYISAFSTLCIVLSAMDGKFEQPVGIKLFMNLCKSAAETLEMLLKAYGEHSLSWTGVFEWLSCFKAGLVLVGSDKCSGRPSTSKTTENVGNI